MNRYFIGLMMPPNIQEHLQALSQSIQAARANDQRYKVSWTLPADLHCTFLFIGETSDEEHLMSYMADIAHRLEPVALTISGQTHWLGRNSLALAVTGAEHIGTEFVEKLGHLSSDKRAGRRPFYGHVTLGRVGRVPETLADRFSGQRIRPMTWTASDVQLVKRNASSSGPRYRVVANRQFRGAA